MVVNESLWGNTLRSCKYPILWLFLFNGFSIHWLFLFTSFITVMIENSDYLGHPGGSVG